MCSPHNILESPTCEPLVRGLEADAQAAMIHRLRKDLEDAKFKAEWETFKHKWEQRRAKIAIARRQQPEEKGGLAIEDSHP